MALISQNPIDMKVKIINEIPINKEITELTVKLFPITSDDLRNITSDEFLEKVTLTVSNMGFSVLEFIERQGTQYIFKVRREPKGIGF